MVTFRVELRGNYWKAQAVIHRGNHQDVVKAEGTTERGACAGLANKLVPDYLSALEDLRQAPPPLRDVLVQKAQEWFKAIQRSLNVVYTSSVLTRDGSEDAVVLDNCGNWIVGLSRPLGEESDEQMAYAVIHQPTNYVVGCYRVYTDALDTMRWLDQESIGRASWVNLQSWLDELRSVLCKLPKPFDIPRNTP